MNPIPVCLENGQQHTREALTPWRLLIIITTLYLTILFIPPQVVFTCFLLITLSIVFLFQPFWGVIFCIIIYPVMSCHIDIFAPVGLPIILPKAVEGPFSTLHMSPMVNPYKMYPYQVAALVLLPTLLLNLQAPSTLHNISWYRRVIIFTLAIFFSWGMITVFLSRYPHQAFPGLVRYACLAVIAVYFNMFIKNFSQLRSIFITYCCVGIILAAFGYIGTYYGFEQQSYIWYGKYMTIIQSQALHNLPNLFSSLTQGMLPGSGLLAKHELSTFIVAAIFSTLFLVITSTEKTHILLYSLSIPFFFITLFYGPSKLSLAGIVLGTMVVTCLCPALRRHIFIIIIFLVSLNIAGLLVSGYTRPKHTQQTTSMSENLKVVNDDSEFSMSLVGRFAIMRDTIAIIKKSHGVGIGPDMLTRDHIFTYPHGHNFFLTILAECGVPALICVLILLIALLKIIYPVLLSIDYLQDKRQLAFIAMTASFIAIFFEYNFDLFSWDPQLWVSGILLAITTNLSRSSKNAD